MGPEAESPLLAHPGRKRTCVAPVQRSAIGSERQNIAASLKFLCHRCTNGKLMWRRDNHTLVAVMKVRETFWRTP